MSEVNPAAPRAKPKSARRRAREFAMQGVPFSIDETVFFSGTSAE